jgi:hypothetical protein
VARIRTVKHELYSDEKVSEVSIQARYLFIGLWSFSDDMGRHNYSPKEIRGLVFPHDKDISDQQVAQWLRDLDKADLIRIYEVETKRYIWLPQFLRHQRIDKPSHSYIPPHPRDRKPDCQCIACKIERQELNPPKHYKPNGRDVPAGTSRRVVESQNLRVGESENPRIEDSTTRRLADSICTGMEWNGGTGMEWREREEQNQNPSSLEVKTESQNQPRATNAEDRRAQIAALHEISIRVLELVGLPSNPMLLDAVTESVRVKSRSEGVSIEESARQIAGKACIVKRDSPPESWLFWFRDAKYDFVPQGDSRLKDRRYEARPTCGHCHEGWEYVTVTIDGQPQQRMRRCEDCRKLWADQNYSSD